jgi:hypothetical protein
MGCADLSLEKNDESKIIIAKIIIANKVNAENKIIGSISWKITLKRRWKG